MSISNIPDFLSSYQPETQKITKYLDDNLPIRNEYFGAAAIKFCYTMCEISVKNIQEILCNLGQSLGKANCALRQAKQDLYLLEHAVGLYNTDRKLYGEFMETMTSLPRAQRPATLEVGPPLQKQRAIEEAKTQYIREIIAPNMGKKEKMQECKQQLTLEIDRATLEVERALQKKQAIQEEQTRFIRETVAPNIEKKVQEWKQHDPSNHRFKITHITWTSSTSLLCIAAAATKKPDIGFVLLSEEKLLDLNIITSCGVHGYLHRTGTGQLTDLSTLCTRSFSDCSSIYDAIKKVPVRRRELSPMISLLCAKPRTSACDSHISNSSLLLLKKCVLQAIHYGHYSNDHLTLSKSQDCVAKLSKEIETLQPLDPNILSRLIGHSVLTDHALTLCIDVEASPGNKGDIVGIKKAGDTVQFAQITCLQPLTVDSGGAIEMVDPSSLVVYDQKRLLKYGCQQRVQSILGLFETEKPISLSPQERSLTIDEIFPIIWGATEMGPDGAWKLGENVTVVFTQSKKVDTLKAWFDEHHLAMTVLSFADMALLNLLDEVDQAK